MQILDLRPVSLQGGECRRADATKRKVGGSVAASTGLEAVIDQSAQMSLEAAGKPRDGFPVVQGRRELEGRDQLSPAHRRDDVENMAATLVGVLAASRRQAREPQQRIVAARLVELTEIVERDLRLRDLREPGSQLVVLREGDGYAEGHAA